MSPDQYRLTCNHGPQECAQKAGELCPAGYDLTGDLIQRWDSQCVTMTVRCREAGG
jgi:hypothetical protein